ncbi:MAG: FtsQ-type POTRA domain-containing protein [Actinomycetota bacterium]|nr:FtsQ-type POTRA domain-containing protein [Actinomycetota bacterium]
MSSRAAASPRSTVDARILQRRREVASADHRRRRRWALSILALIALAVGAVVISRSSLFAITGVRVDGVPAAKAQLVRDIAGVRSGQNLVAVDLAAAQQRVAAVPWVQRVRLERQPPSTVVIVVTPRVPLAAVVADGQTWQVDAEGVVIAPAQPDPARRLVRIDAPQAVLPEPGVTVRDRAVRNALRAHSTLPSALRAAAVRYDAPSEPGLRLLLRLRGLRAQGRALTALPPRMWVRLGTAERMDAKSAVLLELLGQLQRRDPELAITEINVTAPTNPVVVPAS